MEYKYKYKNLAERTARIAEAEGLNYRMLQDNFDSDWQRGKEPHGTLIFTDESQPEPIVGGRDLATEVDAILARLDKLERRRR